MGRTDGSIFNFRGGIQLNYIRLANTTHNSIILVSDGLFDSMYLVINQCAKNNLITSTFSAIFST